MSNAIRHIDIHQTDRFRSINAILFNPDRTRRDLSAASSVTFRAILDSDSSVVINNAAATITGATTGEVRYTLQTADVAAGNVGLWRCYWIVTEGGVTEHFPENTGGFTIRLHAD